MSERGCVCSKEGEIADIKRVMETMWPVVMGNGKESLDIRLTKLEGATKMIKDEVQKSGRIIGGIEKYINTMQGVVDEKLRAETEKKERELRANKDLKWILTTIISILAVIVTTLFNLGLL